MVLGTEPRCCGQAVSAFNSRVTSPAHLQKDVFLFLWHMGGGILCTGAQMSVKTSRGTRSAEIIGNCELLTWLLGTDTVRVLNHSAICLTFLLATF